MRARFLIHWDKQKHGETPDEMARSLERFCNGDATMGRITVEAEGEVPLSRPSIAPRRAATRIFKLLCPLCGSRALVGHMKWTTLKCVNCSRITKQGDWKVPLDTVPAIKTIDELRVEGDPSGFLEALGLSAFETMAGGTEQGGRFIECPECGSPVLVHAKRWTSVKCRSCGVRVGKVTPP